MAWEMRDMKKEEVMALWKACFHDTDEFVRFYFERKYRDEDALVWRDGTGKAVAALQMLPYPMTFGGAEVATSYISGACTLPEARSRGIMRRLLAEAFGKMRARGVAFSTLIPQEEWLYDYYARLGYAPVFRCVEERYVAGDKRTVDGVRVEAVGEFSGLSEELFDYFSSRMRGRFCCVQHPREDYDTVVQDLFASGGKFVTARGVRNEVLGMAFAFPRDGEGLVADWLYDSVKAHDALVAGALDALGVRGVVCRAVARGSAGVRRGMARVIDAEQVLRLYVREHRECGRVIRIVDEQLPVNTGIYRLEGGTSSKVTTPVSSSVPEMTIGELTRWVTRSDGDAPFISLMVD